MTCPISSSAVPSTPTTATRTNSFGAKGRPGSRPRFRWLCFPDRLSVRAVYVAMSTVNPPPCLSVGCRAERWSGSDAGTTVSLCRPRRISECGTTLRRVRLTLLYGGADQAFVAPDPYQCSCPLVQRNRGCPVSELRFLDKRPYNLLYLRLASGPMQAAHAAGPEREIQGSVDAYEDPGKLGLAPHEHDPSHARGSPGEALGYADELHAVLEASYPDAVVSGTELVFDLAHLGHVDSELQESPEHQSGGLVVPLAYSPSRILGGAHNGEAEGAGSCGGRASTRAPNEDRVSFLVRFSDGPVEP